MTVNIHTKLQREHFPLINGVTSILLMLIFSSSAWAQREPEALASDIVMSTATYVTRDSTSLQLDIYTHGDSSSSPRPCVIFVFGGGFMTGSRNQPIYNRYFNLLAHHHYTVISISYRLGLKGVKGISPLRVKPLKKAIDMAVEDVYDATAWLLNKADSLNIDTSRIILSGSSAGAITVLQADYEKRNDRAISQRLPSSFQYAGIVSFAGAILSYHGALKYKHPPAPVLLFHGTDDRLVIYKKIRIFNKAFYGSSHIARVFKRHEWPYYIFRVAGMGHEVAISPIREQQQEILWFLNEYVVNGKPYMKDTTFDNMNKTRTMNLKPSDLYK